jgi:SAM-dependent methyltransferase
MYMTKLDTSWGKSADWYSELLAGEGTYQKEVILPNLLRLMGIKKGEVILDVGSGTGFFSRAFAHEGGEVVGVEIGKELVAKAEAQRDSSTTLGMIIEYHVGSAEKMSFIKNASVDKAVFVLSLQNIENAGAAIGEVARALKPNGKLFVVLNHPAFLFHRQVALSGMLRNRCSSTAIVMYRRKNRNADAGRPPIPGRFISRSNFIT